MAIDNAGDDPDLPASEKTDSDSDTDTVERSEDSGGGGPEQDLDHDAGRLDPGTEYDNAQAGFEAQEHGIVAADGGDPPRNGAGDGGDSPPSDGGDGDDAPSDPDPDGDVDAHTGDPDEYPDEKRAGVTEDNPVGAAVEGTEQIREVHDQLVEVDETTARMAELEESGETVAHEGDPVQYPPDLDAG